MTVPQGNAGGSRKKEKPAIPANITSNAANAIITSSGFVVGTVTNTPGTLEGQHVAGNVAIAVNDTSVAPLGSSINYTIYSPYFPPFFPPYFPPYFPPAFNPGFCACQAAFTYEVWCGGVVGGPVGTMTRYNCIEVNSCVCNCPDTGPVGCP